MELLWNTLRGNQEAMLNLSPLLLIIPSHDLSLPPGFLSHRQLSDKKNAGGKKNCSNRINLISVF